ncbi:hypothetical protein CDV36_015202 [Fusarium kuroshium]|uniref:Uncharacterized protein n=2 Tax=Fusarium solani species complex TaxID=232080 RepID=A0A3M2RDN3_9HYPO|nr:hypothetical protein CDV36_015202 [Fusarium kuroshium]RSL40564.1 hypothetical protein CEP51_016683 [Fusarium floridanum]
MSFLNSVVASRSRRSLCLTPLSLEFLVGELMPIFPPQALFSQLGRRNSLLPLYRKQESAQDRVSAQNHTICLNSVESWLNRGEVSIGEGEEEEEKEMSESEDSEFIYLRHTRSLVESPSPLSLILMSIGD